MGKKFDEKNIIEITSLIKKPVLYTKNKVSLEIKQNPRILGISDIVRSIYTNDEINNFKNEYSCS